MATEARGSDAGVTALLSAPRFELMPFSSFDEQMAHLPDGAAIAITMSPQQGLEATLQKTEVAMEAGYEAIPHIAARYVEGPDQLEEIAARLEAAGVTDVFIPGGDPEEPVGEYESAYDLLVDLEELDYAFDEVGITGYPEGHAFISEAELESAMAKKAPHATYIVTQLCYDPDAVIDWLEMVRRDREIDLPVEVGIPGVLKYQRLLSISQKVGVGDSVRFLQKTSGILGFVRQLIGSRGKYTPYSLVDGLAPYVDDPESGIDGVHIYTFNQVPDTEEWRQGRLSA
ncbi:MAG: methylenetetrahydrofolate reductase [Halobacteriales archaeon]